MSIYLESNDIPIFPFGKRATIYPGVAPLSGSLIIYFTSFRYDVLPQSLSLHWHCDAPAATVTTTGTGAESVTIAPSPTESVGCEQHGDHWHCEAPAVRSDSSVGRITSVAANRTVTPSLTQATFISSSGATLHGAGYGFFAALVILAVSMSL
ncbi:hypothetical protein IFR04_012375 [Cadophora malorum]|uniref:Uncharacterized protein n=1 Tax=Cadophora malorum TaxID=108018 RepID=A0A8H7T939_9HELO|nr:hypothetical protein IFR04_012375 [Cadophora malorum]